jgi:hypothetical protein
MLESLAHTINMAANQDTPPTLLPAVGSDADARLVWSGDVHGGPAKPKFHATGVRFCKVRAAQAGRCYVRA